MDIVIYSLDQHEKAEAWRRGLIRHVQRRAVVQWLSNKRTTLADDWVVPLLRERTTLPAGRKKGDSWESRVRNELRRNVPSLMRDFNKYVDRTSLKITVDTERKPELAPWAGSPFVIAGNISTVAAFFRRCADQWGDMLHDHEFYWVLTSEESDVLKRRIPKLPGERDVGVCWGERDYDVIAHALYLLAQSPTELVGFSRGLNVVRSGIDRLASDAPGPSSPVLLLGESGVGKTAVAEQLHSRSVARSEKGFGVVACGWFTPELLQDQLFGHVRGAFNDAIKDKAGLLKTYKEGTLLLDDFDAAPKDVQGALLTLMATKKGAPATYLPLGAEKEDTTEVWLIVGTNRNIENLVANEEMRADFVFRFEHRVLHIPPLRERPADIPAITYKIWAELWDERSKPPVLSSTFVRKLTGLDLEWSGNVRALRALLSLVASRFRQTRGVLPDILEEIVGRGPDVVHWVGAVVPRTTALRMNTQPHFTHSRVREILQLDLDHDCGPRKALWPSTGSERLAKSILENLTRPTNAVDRFRRIVNNAPAKWHPVHPSVRLSRLICFLSKYEDIDRRGASELCGVGRTHVVKDLQKLAPFIHLKKHNTGGGRGDQWEWKHT